MPDSTPSNEPIEESTAAGRARELWRRAAPALREVGTAIEKSGGLDEVKGIVVERAGEIARRVDSVVANARAIEGEVVEPTPGAPVVEARADAQRPPAAPRPAHRGRRTIQWQHVAIVAGAATFGALMVQRRRAARD